MLFPDFNRTIWTLWLQGVDKAPKLVRDCHESWRHHNPEWRLEVLSRADVDALWTSDRERAVAAKMPASALANLVRMKLLVTHGGVWADATLACVVRLENWLWTYTEGDFFALSDAPGWRPLDNFFLAGCQGDAVLTDWLAASLNAWSQPSVRGRDPVEDCSRWISGIKEGKGKPWRRSDFWHGIETMPYYWHHYLFDYMLAKRAGLASYWKNRPKCSARLPLLMEFREAYDEAAMEEAAFRDLLHNNMVPFHKLNWRRMDAETMPRVRALLDHCCGRG